MKLNSLTSQIRINFKRHRIMETVTLSAYFGDTHPGISVISTQFVSYKMALGCKFIISFLNSHLLSQNDAKSVQFCPGSHQQ